ncbi:MAG: hypothetical protein ACJA1Y_001388, partial [Burkholderiaceae bacterium]
MRWGYPIELNDSLPGKRAGMLMLTQKETAMKLKIKTLC